MSLCFVGVGVTRATLVSELMERGETILRDKRKSANFSASKVNESICALLCDAGLEALERVARYSSVFQDTAITCREDTMRTLFNISCFI